MKGLRDYQGRTAIVTGASTGLGAEFARQFARRGMRVALVSRRLDELEKVAAGICREGGDAIVIPCDVGDRGAVIRAAEEARTRLGRVDLLVNNAGYNTHVLFKDHPLDDVERMVQVNVLGQIYWIKAVLPAMRERGEGWIVNLSSVAGKLGQPDEAVYAATKFGIHVLCVHPAVVRTEMFTPEVLARMPEIAKRSFIDADVFCEAVIAALARGSYEVTVPRHVGIAYFFRLLMPGLFRRQTAKFRLPVIPDLTT